MKLLLVLITSIVMVINAYAQTITVRSITHSRQSNGGQYTLDGTQMTSSGRLKLLSSSNFGATGVYPKSISITDGYIGSNSLTSVVSLPYSTIFYFGTFDKAEGTLVQFTIPEIDSLYNWSKRGGRLIICGSSGDGAYNPSVLNSKWGFQAARVVPSSFIPTAAGQITDIFSGPFGTIDSALQGGSMQGYFNTVPSDISVLATDRNNHPTIIMDCSTLDLIVADVDGFSALDGPVTTGSAINSDQDKYLANTFVFMDKLQPLPQVTNSAGTLSLNSTYNSYQWYWNNTPVSGAVSPSYAIMDTGYYFAEVTVNGGCKVRSAPVHASSAIGIQEIGNDQSFLLFPNPASGQFSVLSEEGALISVTNILGQEVIKLITVQKNTNLALEENGVYFVSVTSGNRRITQKLIINH